MKLRYTNVLKRIFEAAVFKHVREFESEATNRRVRQPIGNEVQSNVKHMAAILKSKMAAPGRKF